MGVDGVPNGPFINALKQHGALGTRHERSQEKLALVRQRVSDAGDLIDDEVCLFCAGSIARGEAGEKSDLDIFVTADRSPRTTSTLYGHKLLSELIRLNEDLGFPEFSNNGQYLKIYLLEDLKNKTGSPRDDIENLFTARLLLLLESQPLSNVDTYARHRAGIIDHYFRDEAGKETFRPLFLLNDVLRYWRTLCLNYEDTRHDADRPWRKKNVSLKFSRMVTVFASVLPLIILPMHELASGAPLWNLSPLWRLGFALDSLADEELLEDWAVFLNTYSEFLDWKELEDIEGVLKDDGLKPQVAEAAEFISGFLYRALTHDEIPAEIRRYLIL